VCVYVFPRVYVYMFPHVCVTCVVVRTTGRCT